MVFAALAMLALSVPATAEPLQTLRQDASSTLLAQGAGQDIPPPYEILTIVRSIGLDPLGHPVRRGANYVLRAIDNDDREVRVLVDARTGDIVSVTPIATASRTGPGGLTMGPYQPMAPEGYIQPARPVPYRAGPPIAFEDDEPGAYSPRPPVSVRGGPPPAVSAAPPPVIRAIPSLGASPRPTPGSRDIASNAPHVDGLLPPPPERFPQRAPPLDAAKPKPLKRAVAEIPKQAPLPKPRPASNVNASPAPSLVPDNEAAATSVPH
jgi:hypothetical protein